MQNFLQARSLVSRINEHNTVCVPHQAEGRDERTGVQMPGPEEFKVFFVLFEMRRTRRMWCVVYEESARLIGGKGKQLTFLILLGPQDPAKRQAGGGGSFSRASSEAQPNSKNPILSFDQASDKIV